MKRSRLLIPLAVVFALLAISVQNQPVQADAPDGSVPPDFVLIDNAPGVDLYRKDYSGGTPDFVLVIDLTKGVGLQLLHGPLDGAGAGSGAFGGSNPGFSRQSLQQMWDSFSAANSDAVCVVNGTIFDAADDPARLALPLKVNGQIISEGSWRDEYSGQKRMLEIWPDRVRISNLSAEALAASDAPDILSGLSEDANRDSSALIGRTFIGIDDADENGTAETVLVFSSKTTRTADAAGVLRHFGADDVIMLDNGDSSQMMCNNQPQVYSSRAIPQAVGVISGKQAAYAMRVKKQTDWAIVVVDKALDIELVLTNTGTETWRAGEVKLVNQRNPWGAGETLSLPADIPPDGSVTLGWTTPPFEKSGVFLSQWDIVRGSTRFNDKPININVIVIPPELEDKKVELEEQIREWAQQQVDDMEQRIMDWIQAQVRKGIEQICPFGAALPGVVVAGEVWKSRRRKKK